MPTYLREETVKVSDCRMCEEFHDGECGELEVPVKKVKGCPLFFSRHNRHLENGGRMMTEEELAMWEAKHNTDAAFTGL